MYTYTIYRCIDISIHIYMDINFIIMIMPEMVDEAGH